MKNIEELAKIFDKGATYFEDVILDSELKTIGKNIIADIRLLTPVAKGWLRRSFEFSINNNSKNKEIVISNPLKYAASVNYGKRITKAKKTVGKRKGVYMLEKGIENYKNEQLEHDVKKILNRLGKSLC